LIICEVWSYPHSNIIVIVINFFLILLSKAALCQPRKKGGHFN